MGLREGIFPNRKKSWGIFCWTIFILINFYIGWHIFHQFRVFKERNFPISIAPLAKTQPVSIRITDINQDNISEIAYSWISNYPGQLAFSLYEPYQSYFNYPFYFDIIVSESNRFIDAFFSKKHDRYVARFLSKDGEDNHKIIILNNDQDVIDEIHLDSPRFNQSKVDNRIRHLLLADLNKDGEKELLLFYYSFYARGARGIASFNPLTGKLYWNFEMGAQIEDIRLLDVDGDLREEIILSTFACNNGAVANGTSDDKTYVMVISGNGKEIWKKITGKWYTRAMITTFDLNGDAKPKIITTIENHRGGSEIKGKIIIFEASTGDEKVTFLNREASYSKPVVYNSRDEGPSIYVGDSFGSIHRFNKDLKHLNQTKSVNRPLRILGETHNIQSLNHIFAITKGGIMAWDFSLNKRIFHYPLDPAVVPESMITTPSTTFWALNSKDGNQAVIGINKVYMIKEKNPELKGIIKDLIGTGLFLSLFILILFNLFSLFIWRESLGRGDLKNGNSAEVIEMVQKITHQIKTPISTILWVAEKIKRNIKNLKDKKNQKMFSQMADFLTDDVGALKQHTRDILYLLRIQDPNFKELNLGEFIKEIISPYQNLLKEKIQFKLEAEQDIQVLLDGDLIKELIINIIDNSIDAIKTQGVITISLIPMTSPLKASLNKVIIEIEDTGIGMDEKTVSRVFDPFFTQKEKGSGLGLFICRRIVKLHGGEIKIHSRKHFGTKLDIILPVKKRK